MEGEKAFAWLVLLFCAGIIFAGLMIFNKKFRKAVINYFDLNKAHERAVKRRESSK